MISGEYYQTKCRETGNSDKLKQCIENACEYCIDNMQSTVLGNPYYKGEHPLMLLGYCIKMELLKVGKAGSIGGRY